MYVENIRIEAQIVGGYNLDVLDNVSTAGLAVFSLTYVECRVSGRPGSERNGASRTSPLLVVECQGGDGLEEPV